MGHNTSHWTSLIKILINILEATTAFSHNLSPSLCRMPERHELLTGHLKKNLFIFTFNYYLERLENKKTNIAESDVYSEQCTLEDKNSCAAEVDYYNC